MYIRERGVANSSGFYIASLSTRTIIYKGMVIAARLAPIVARALKARR